MTQPRSAFGVMTETDPNHCHAAMSLNLFFGMMLYSIRGKVLDVMEEKETGVSQKELSQVVHHGKGY